MPLEEEEPQEEEEIADLIYDTVLMRDTCGNSRPKIKNYFYHRVYNSKNFKYISSYDELILLDVIEGTKKRKDYLKTLIPFIILICLGGLSIFLWIFLYYCYKKPKGCLKRYSKSNKTTRDSCFFIFFGFCSVILILIIVTIVYLNYAEMDINGAVCSLSMLRYEIVYGQSLLEKKGFKKPFWYGTDSLSENVRNVRNFIYDLQTNCENIINPPIEKSDEDGLNDLDRAGKTLTEGLEDLYVNNKDKVISNANPEDGTDTIPLYISNLGFKENNETYTGKIYQQYENNYEYLLKKVIDPIIEICQDYKDDEGIDDLPSALEKFNDVISTLEDSMDLIAIYVTKRISDKLIDLKNIYYVFYLIFLSLMGITIATITILFFIYYYKPVSAMNYSIKVVLYIMNFLMIFCIVLTGLTGIIYKYFSDSSDIVDCMYSSKNIGSADPRLIPRITNSSVLTRCVRGDGNLLDEYLTDKARKDILNLKKINTIYLKIVEAYNRITSEKKNEYNTLSSLDQVMEEFKLMKYDCSLTTSREESGTGDINYMLNKLNQYTLPGMAQGTSCDNTKYHLWTLNEGIGQTVQINPDENNNEVEIEYKYIIGNADPHPEGEYDGVCESNFKNYYDALKHYNDKNIEYLDILLDKLEEMKKDFEDKFIGEMPAVIRQIKTLIADPFWDVFGKLVNDTTNYSGVEDAENVDILGWVNCSFLGQDYNITMNTFKETLIPDLKIVTYCSLVFEILIIVLYFIIISLANNIRDKESEKNENGYDIESIKDDGGEIFEIVENNKYKKKYDAEGELITINRLKSKPKRSKLYSASNTESGNINIKTDKSNDITKEDDINSIKKKLPNNIVQVPKFDIAENIEAIKNVDVRKLIDKNGRAVMHPIRISINSPLGVMEASDKYAHLYNYDVFEPYKEEESGEGSDIENGSYYQKNGKKSNKGKSNKKLGKVKKGKKGKKSEKDKESKQSDSFSF